MAVLPPDPIFTFKKDMGFVHCLCIPPSPQRPNLILAGSEDGHIFIWSFETNRLLYKMNVGPSLLCILHTQDKLITQEKRGVIRIHTRINSLQYEETASINGGYGYCRCILRNERGIFTAQDQSVVEQFDLQTYKSIATYRVTDPVGAVMCLCYFQSNNGHYLLVGYEAGDVILWDVDVSKQLSRVKLRECLVSLDYDTNNNRGICGNASEYLQIFQVSRDLSEMTLKCEMKMTNAGSSIVRLRDDKRIVVSGGWDGHVYVYSWRSLRLLAVLTEHRGATISDVIFSNGLIAGWGKNIMAVTAKNGVISLWDLYNN